MTTYGIDLGTTYSCIAHVDQSGRATVIKNMLGEDTTPSVVFFETPDHVVIGRDAKDSAKLNPDLVVALIKRAMGTQVSTPYHGVEHSPESISALILKDVAHAAEQYNHEPVRDVVITVPAYFGVTERQATRHAGEIAGLNVVSLVPEPVAAALHYNAVTAEGDRTLLVFDLGGGTFDTTVIKVHGGDITVVCTDGDHHLGGADWDEKIADYLLQQFCAEHPDAAAEDDEEFLQGLATAAEGLKKQLSSTKNRRHNIQFASRVSRVELSRQTFEQLTAPLLDRVFDITERTLALAKQKDVAQFDDVLLVGGATRMPAVAAGLRERFGFEPKLHDPDLAVAKGAALFGLLQSVKVAIPAIGDDGEARTAAATDEAVREAADHLGLPADQVRELVDKQVITVAPRAFGVKTLRSDLDDEFLVDHLIKANDPLPASPPTTRYATAYENQTQIQVEVWEQAGARESPELDDNTAIGSGLISGLPPLPKGSPIDVTFRMDPEGALRVHAVELKTGKDLDIELTIEGLSQEQVEQARDSVARYAVSE